MPARPRALAGTREGSRRCLRCNHVMIRHQDGGTGECAHSTAVTTRDPDGTAGTRLVRCTCPNFATEGMIF